MKYFLFILVTLLSMTTKGNEFILIEHIGISDKPIQSILISKHEIKNDINDCIRYIVEDSVYDLIKNVVFEFRENKNENINYEFGSFIVKIHENNIADQIYYFERLNSIQLINQVLINLEKVKVDNKALIIEFEKLYRRIKM